MKCEICHKKNWEIIFDFHGYGIYENKILIHRKLLVCYECLCAIIGSLINVVSERNGSREEKDKLGNFINKQNIVKKSVKNLTKDHRKGSIVPSIPWGKRQRMGKISKDELIDINLWINKIKNAKDFKEIK